MAHVVERHLAPAEAPPDRVSPLAEPALPPTVDDDRPIGPDLRAIAVIGLSDKPSDAATPSLPVDLGRIKVLDTDGGRGALTPFIGQPLSRKKLAAIQVAIVRQMRREGRPFASVTLPEQDITQGVLIVRVVEFRAESVKVAATSKAQAAHIRNAVRLKHGELIDADQLSEDLDALNAYPFRTVAATFEQGDALGDTRLLLSDTERRPVAASVGYSNSGPRLGTSDRWYVGLQMAGLPGSDALISYQVTGSDDFWRRGGRYFSETHPEYMSHSLRAYVPLAPRHGLEASFNFVETNVAGDPFSLRLRTEEGSLGYRGALSDYAFLAPGLNLSGQISLGVETRGQKKVTLFFGEQALKQHMEIYQAYVGWNRSWFDDLGRTAISVSGHYSPGRVDHENSDQAFTLYSRGRITKAQYNYAQLEADRLTRLPFGLSFSNQLTVQFTGQSLPDTELMALGGEGSVRGYRLDDGAFDRGAVLRNELHAPTQAHAAPFVNGLGIALAPFVFADLGWAQSFTAAQSARVASVGAGGDLYLGTHASLGVNAGYALSHLGETRSGDWKIDVRARLAY